MTDESRKPWHFTRETNAKGYTYIYACQTAWDPVRKRSRRAARQYVGRLADGGRVLLSSRFIEPAGGIFMTGRTRRSSTSAPGGLSFRKRAP